MAWQYHLDEACKLDGGLTNWVHQCRIAAIAGKPLPPGPPNTERELNAVMALLGET